MNLYGNISDKVALAGMLYGMNPKSVVSYPAGETISFGKAVYLKDGTITHSGLGGAVFVGAAIRHQCEGGEYLAKDTVGVVNDGCIWVVVDTDSSEVKDGDLAYVTSDGIFTTDGAAGARETVGKFKSTAKDGLALVDLSK